MFRKDNGIFIFRFQKKEDMDWVLEESHRMFWGCFFILRKWQPRMKLDKSSLNSMHIWVTLLDLDLQFWSADMLSCIVSQIARPCHTDKLMTQMEGGIGNGRLSYARILVEVDASKALKGQIILRNEMGKKLYRRSGMNGSRGSVSLARVLGTKKVCVCSKGKWCNNGDQR